MIKFITPNYNYQQKFNEMRDESRSIGEDVSLYGLDSIEKHEALKQYPEYIPNSVYWILDQESDKLIGVVIIRHRLRDENDKNGHIFLIIRPNKRNMGYGTLAINFAITKCEELGIQNPTLETQSENINAIRMLENSGCVKTQSYDENGYKKQTYCPRKF